MTSQPSRRDFIRIAAGLCVAAHGLPANASDTGGARGCCIVPANADSAYRDLFNAPPSEAAQSPWRRRLSTDSGVSRAFERQFGGVLADISRHFEVVPGFSFYDDEDSPNAVAIDKAVIRTTKGTVAFGRRLLREQLAIDSQGISVAAISAHEFAHIFQYQSGFFERIERAYPRHIIELQADFLAGVYLRHFEQDRRNLSLQGVGRAWEEMGETRFTKQSTHGTTAMRLDSIQAGYFWRRDHSDERLYRAASAGLDHVRQYANG